MILMVMALFLPRNYGNGTELAIETIANTARKSDLRAPLSLIRDHPRALSPGVLVLPCHTRKPFSKAPNITSARTRMDKFWILEIQTRTF